MLVCFLFQKDLGSVCIRDLTQRSGEYAQSARSGGGGVDS